MWGDKSTGMSPMADATLWDCQPQYDPTCNVCPPHDLNAIFFASRAGR
ncbi:hypothetical protein APY04_2676 [Hyphomicrobium sulfonivorans]|uniref:Uncharacterized protein n=1 Tax=Hyphomicrobium sulfonivorans TaxID=121290 RepID=A0A109BC01_HYPSL|nr:hypothetical protein APY04_2676 [Hyphomicrobium sulfonivorans]